jgi:hypothetical protein
MYTYMTNATNNIRLHNFTTHIHLIRYIHTRLVQYILVHYLSQFQIWSNLLQGFCITYATLLQYLGNLHSKLASNSNDILPNFTQHYNQLCYHRHSFQIQSNLLQGFYKTNSVLLQYNAHFNSYFTCTLKLILQIFNQHYNRKCVTTDIYFRWRHNTASCTLRKTQQQPRHHQGTPFH